MTAPGPPAVGPSRPARPHGGGESHRPAARRWWLPPGLLALVLAAVLLRIAGASRPGLWADEIFSLAIATGHSLEHPAAEADPGLGDFVEPRDARSPALFRRYAQHDGQPAGARRVVRSVLLSDTNPPLYYLLLNPWTRAFGTGDAALRLFSVWWAVLSLPLLWLVARELGGERAAWSACVLFAFSPVGLYYSSEGRMYSLLWFLALGLVWLTLRVSGAGGRPQHAALWVLSGTAGLLTHYFFVFVWLACAGWLWLEGSPGRRRHVAALAGATLLAGLPWYLAVPASLARWRVSGGWLDGDPVWPSALGRPFALAGSLLSGSSYLGGWRHADGVLAVLFLLLALWIARHGSVRSLFSDRRLLLWGWLAASCVGPLVFDTLRHTATTEVPRYVLPALPAALLLAAFAMSRLSPRLHLAFLGAVLLAWLPGARKATLPSIPRPSQPYRLVDARLMSWAGADDLVLVSATPSGVVGVARYLEREIPMASWVPQLGTRELEPDLQRLLAGRRRVALVKITHLGAPAPAEAWLRVHARPLGRDTFRSSKAEVLYFGPREGEAFFPEAAP